MSYKCDFDGSAGEELTRIARAQGRSEGEVIADAAGLYRTVADELRNNQKAQLAIVTDVPELIIAVPGLR